MGIFSKPKTPDPYQTAQAQADANRVGQITPQGNLTYGKMDESGNFTPNTSREVVQVSESPDQQYLRQQREGIASALMGVPIASTNDIRLSLPGSALSGLPAGAKSNITGGLNKVENAADIGALLPSVSNDYSADAQRAADATYGLGLARLDPYFQEQRRATNTDLVNRGLPVGGEAYGTEMDRLDRSQGEQMRNLALSSILAGNDQSARLFDQAIRGRESEYGIQSGILGLSEQQRAQRFNEQMAEQALAEQIRQNRVGEQFGGFDRALGRELSLSGLENQRLGLASQLSSNTPNFVNVPGIDIAGLINQNYQTQSNQYASDNQALGNLLGNAAMAAGMFLSDARLKENITPSGLHGKYPLYEFNYIGNSMRYIGVMAQEVREIDPDAVHNVDGLLMVDYDKINVPFIEVVQ